MASGRGIPAPRCWRSTTTPSSRSTATCSPGAATGTTPRTSRPRSSWAQSTPSAAARPDVTTAWLIGIARHKLVDHWRRPSASSDGSSRRRRARRAEADDDPWDAHLDVLAARDVLDQLGAHHRAALTLRYLDGLPVPEVAAVLDRTVHATEALLVRARRAFRDVYEDVERGEEVRP